MTPPRDQNIISPKYTLEADELKRGSVLCQKCKNVRRSRSCPKCGYDAVCIRISWQGTPCFFYRDKHGNAYSFSEAVKDLLTINQQIESGEFDPREYETRFRDEKIFRSAFSKWLEQKENEVKDNRLSPETLRPYQSYHRNYFGYFDDMDVREIKLKHLQTFLDGLLAVLSAKYKKNMMNCLHAFFEWLKRWGDIKELPVFPEMRVHDSRIMTPIPYEAQLEAIIHIPEEHRDIFILMRETGIRISEAGALKGRDIDHSNKRILIQRNWSGAKLQETTKGRRKDWIPLSNVAYEMVRKNSLNKFGNDFIFDNPTTQGPYKPEFMRRLWKKYSGTETMLKEAMRHSTLSDWANHGASAFQIKELARHSDIRVSDNYVKNAKQGLYDIVNRKVVPIGKKKRA